MVGYETWPASRGYRMPAEWERHGATWLSWPHNLETWPGALREVEEAMVSVVGALAHSEAVWINVLNEAHERHVASLLGAHVPDKSVTFFRFPTNDAWCRDYGAIFVTSDRQAEPIMALNFEFNAWGEKYSPYHLDRAIPKLMAGAFSISLFSPGIVLEGGSVDVNGAGAVLTTEQCLLNANRNPELDRTAIEARLGCALGVEQIIWLASGIEGDDTDGHIDDIARFVAPDRVVMAIESNSDDPNFLPLRLNRERLSGVRLVEGQALEVMDLPMPGAIYHLGRRLPASYANFYVANDIVLMPVFGCPQDEVAGEVLSGCFASRRVVSIDCRHIVRGLGALHCLTQQVPFFR